MEPKRGYRAFGELANLAIVLFILLPVAALLLGSLQTERDLLSNVNNIWPEHITIGNLRDLATGAEISGLSQSRGFPRSFLNSLIVALGTTFLTVVFGSFSAYALARLKVRGTKQIMYGVLATRMVPIVVLIIPLYVMLRHYGLLNSLAGIIVAQSGFFLPYAIWILIAYFASLPSELEEAAVVDGCTRFGAFWRIIVPISTPGIAACGVIIFLMSWNDLLLPLILGSTDRVMTLPVLISTFVTSKYISYSVLNASGIIALVPTVVLVVLLQRFIVRGLTAGAVKG
jgi:multiple sugar transport system permease protein